LLHCQEKTRAKKGVGAESCFFTPIVTYVIQHIDNAWWSVCGIGAMKGAGGASCHGGQLCDAWNKCFTTAAPKDLIKKVVQKCVCPFLFLHNGSGQRWL